MRSLLVLGALSFVVVPLTGCDDEEGSSEETLEVTAPTLAELLRPFSPLAEVQVDEQKMQLGRHLYFDTSLSGDGTVSCASCHSFAHGGAEPRATSVGIRDQVGPINAPTVLNSALNFVQFWDGRAATLQEQAAGPVANPMEMGAEWDAVVAKLSEDESYTRRFEALYDDGLTQDNVTDAIAEYERSLVTPSPFDAFLRGDESALTERQRQGFEVFATVGCQACHIGEGVGGGMYQKMGLLADYFADRGGEITEADLGRFNVTQDESDRHFFKVPMLRNVELTGPYLHDGSQRTLEDVVRVMGRFQVAADLSDEQVELIVEFLKALTGELPPQASEPTPIGDPVETPTTAP